MTKAKHHTLPTTPHTLPSRHTGPLGTALGASASVGTFLGLQFSAASQKGKTPARRPCNDPSVAGLAPMPCPLRSSSVSEPHHHRTAPRARVSFLQLQGERKPPSTSSLLTSLLSGCSSLAPCPHPSPNPLPHPTTQRAQKQCRGPRYGKPSSCRPPSPSCHHLPPSPSQPELCAFTAIRPHLISTRC